MLRRLRFVTYNLSMKVTKFEHSGFLIEENERGLLIDPVEFEKTLPSFENIDAIVITHKHGDHFQPAVIEKIRTSNPDVVILTTNDNAAAIVDAKAVEAGDVIKVGEFDLEFFGKSHAEIVPGMIPCENIGVVVNKLFAHLGDSLDFPKEEVEAIAVASAAPWLKMYEAMEYITKAKAKVFIPCHDAILSDVGRGINNNWLSRACAEVNTKYAALLPEESLELK